LRGTVRREEVQAGTGGERHRLRTSSRTAAHPRTA
jgi:hypothetical protein